MTQVLSVNPDNPEPEYILHAARLLREGKLVAFPTETVYGLGANALDPQAVSRIFAAKGRPPNDPLIVHLATIDKLPAVAKDIPPQAHILAREFWPGPLTLIFRRQPDIPLLVTAGQETVAVRIPSNPIALALIRTLDSPIAAPSANLFSKTSPTSARHVWDDLSGRIDLILDGGQTRIGLESTVLDITRSPPEVLRPGGTPFERLKRFLPDLVLRAVYQSLGTPDRLVSPGTQLKHYAPKATLILLEGDRTACLKRMEMMISEKLVTGQKVGLLLTNEDAAVFLDFSVEIVTLGPESDLEQVAHNLFAALRELDSRGVDMIIARAPSKVELGLTIWDRLYRAAQGNLVHVD